MPDTTQVETDAKALGTAALVAARGAITSLLTAVATSAEAKVPALEADAVNLGIEFVPSAAAAELDPILDGVAGAALPPIQTETAALIKSGLGIALSRIDALLPASA